MTLELCFSFNFVSSFFFFFLFFWAGFFLCEFCIFILARMDESTVKIFQSFKAVGFVGLCLALEVSISNI